MKYSVKVSRVVTSTTNILVDAADENAAGILAEEQADDVDEENWQEDGPTFEADEVTPVDE